MTSKSPEEVVIKKIKTLSGKMIQTFFLESHLQSFDFLLIDILKSLNDLQIFFAQKFLKVALLKTIERLGAKVNPVFGFKDPDLIKMILVKDFNYFTDHGFYVNEEKEPTSGHLFRLQGEKWRRLRRTVSPAFTVGKLKMVFPAMVSIGGNLNKALAAEDGNSIDMLDFCLRYNADIIASVIFGIDTKSFECRDNEYILMGKNLFSQYSRWRMLKFILLVLSPQFLELFNPKTVQKKQERFIFEMVRKVVEYRENNNVSRNDIMQLLMELKNKEECQSEEDNSFHKEINEDKIKLTMEDLAAQAYTYFFAGFESTSNTMNFLLYHCALDNVMQTKIQQEIDDVLESCENVINYETVSKQQYLHQVILETLRFYPILPHLNRMAVRDYTIPESNINIEKGTRIFISISGIQHDPEHYPNPENFDPDRFSPENMMKRNPFTYLPFGEGPRNCIGKKMGIMMVALGVTMVLKDYSVSVCKDTQIPLKFSPFTYNYTTTKKIKLKIMKRY